MESLDEFLRLVLVQGAGLCPKPCDNGEWNVLIFRQDRKFAKAGKLVRIEVLQARLDASADRPVPLSLVRRVESSQPALLKPVLEPGDGVLKLLAQAERGFGSSHLPC